VSATLLFSLGTVVSHLLLMLLRGGLELAPSLLSLVLAAFRLRFKSLAAGLTLLPQRRFAGVEKQKLAVPSRLQLFLNAALRHLSLQPHAFVLCALILFGALAPCGLRTCLCPRSLTADDACSGNLQFLLSLGLGLPLLLVKLVPESHLLRNRLALKKQQRLERLRVFRALLVLLLLVAPPRCMGIALLLLLTERLAHITVAEQRGLFEALCAVESVNGQRQLNELVGRQWALKNRSTVHSSAGWVRRCVAGCEVIHVKSRRCLITEKCSG
jgi:hypothetical protein